MARTWRSAENSGCESSTTSFTQSDLRWKQVRLWCGLCSFYMILNHCNPLSLFGCGLDLLFVFVLSIMMFCPMRKYHSNDLFRSSSNSCMISALAGKTLRGEVLWQMLINQDFIKVCVDNYGMKTDIVDAGFLSLFLVDRYNSFFMVWWCLNIHREKAGLCCVTCCISLIPLIIFSHNLRWASAALYLSFVLARIGCTYRKVGKAVLGWWGLHGA